MNISEYDYGRNLLRATSTPQYGVPALQFPMFEKLAGMKVQDETNRQLQAGQFALNIQPRRQELELGKKDWELAKKLGRQERTAGIINVGLSALGGVMTARDYLRQQKQQEQMKSMYDIMINIIKRQDIRMQQLYQTDRDLQIPIGRP